MAAPGPTALSNDSTNHGHILQNVAIALIVLDVAFVALRIYTRASRGLRGRLDEWLVILGLVFNVGVAVCGIVMYQTANIGHHLAWVKAHEPQSLVQYAKIQIPFELLFILAYTFAKLAILCLYSNIFVEPWQRWVNYGLMGLVAVAGLAGSITTLVQCVPLSYAWNKAGHPGGHCINPNLFWRYCTLPNVPIDVAMFLIPFPCIWKLQLSWKDKVGLAISFMTGSVGIITAVIRMAILFQTGSTDSTWNAVTFGSITIAEGSTYLMAACLPLYRPLFQSAGKRIQRTLGRSMISRPGVTHESKKGSLGSELQSIRQDKGFERLDDFNHKTAVTSQHYDVDSDVYGEANSMESGLGKRNRSGIQVKKEFVVNTIETRN